MPTNDERREVAAKLREKHNERVGTLEPQSIYIQAMNRLDDILDCLPKRRDVLLDLADLIEPELERTCRFNDAPDKAVAICSACGFEAGIYDCDWYDDDPKYVYTGKYCSECGARVVKE